MINNVISTFMFGLTYLAPQVPLDASSAIPRNFLFEKSCGHGCVKALKAKASLLVGYTYASMAHIPFCVAGFLKDLVPFLDQVFIKKVLEVRKRGIYVPFYLFWGLIKLPLELLAMGTSLHVKSIVLLLEVVEEELHIFCSS